MGGEAGDPVVGLREREAVELVGHVDATARVDVLQPGAAHVGVLLEHRDLHPGLAQAVRRRQARGTRTDDRAAEGAADLAQTPRRFPRVGPLERELLGQEALPVLGGAGADQEPEDPPPLVRRQGVIGPAGGQVGRQRRAGEPHAPRPPARATGPARARAAAPGPARSPREGATGPPCGAPPRTGGDARPPPRRPPSAVSRRRRLPVASAPPMRTSLCSPPRPAGHAEEPAGRPGQCPMCLPSSAIWLFTSTVRGSLSMAVARLSAVQRSSVSTESAMDQPP